MNKWMPILIAVLTGCCLAFGQVPATETDSRNGFSATVMLTKKPEEFVRKWATASASSKLTIETPKEVHLGEYVAALVFFRGCRTGVDSCRVYVDFELVAPDGSIRHRVPDRDGTAQPQPRMELAYLSRAIVQFQFKPGDPLGQYWIKATVREPANGNILHVSEKIRVVQ